MKNWFLTILLFSLISETCLAQLTVSELRQINNTPQFKGGEQAFRIHFMKSLRYPMAFSKKQEACTILGVIKVSKKGKIQKITSLNKVPEPFLDEFIKAAKLTAGKWKPTNDTSDSFYTVIPVEFSYQGAKYQANFDYAPKFFKEATVVIAYPQASPNEYTADSRYIEKVIALVSEKKYPEAIEIMELLLSRQPLNPDYYSMIIDLYTKSGIKEQADFYSTLLKFISNKS
jgi:hypothetical protein